MARKSDDNTFDPAPAFSRNASFRRNRLNPESRFALDATQPRRVDRGRAARLSITSKSNASPG
jgi:hypothetical protein